MKNINHKFDDLLDLFFEEGYKISLLKNKKILKFFTIFISIFISIFLLFDLTEDYLFVATHVDVEEFDPILKNEMG